MKKFQLEPITNKELVKIVFDRLITLGYTTNNPDFFLDRAYWSNQELGQWIHLGYHKKEIYRGVKPLNEKAYPILCLNQLFHLTPIDCQNAYSFKVTESISATFNADHVYIPYGVAIDNIVAIEFARKILEVLE